MPSQQVRPRPHKGTHATEPLELELELEPLKPLELLELELEELVLVLPELVPLELEPLELLVVPEPLELVELPDPVLPALDPPPEPVLVDALLLPVGAPPEPLVLMPLLAPVPLFVPPAPPLPNSSLPVPPHATSITIAIPGKRYFMESGYRDGSPG